MDYNDAIMGINCAEIFEGGGGVGLSATEEKWVRIIRELAVIRGKMTLTKDKILACWRNEPCLVRANEAAYVKAFRDYYEYVMMEGLHDEGPVLFGMKLAALEGTDSVLTYKSKAIDVPVFYDMSRSGDNEFASRISVLLKNFFEEPNFLEVLTMTVNLYLERNYPDKVFMIPARIYDCVYSLFFRVDPEQRMEFVNKYFTLTWDSARNDYVGEYEVTMLAERPDTDYVRCFYKAPISVYIKEDYEETVEVMKSLGSPLNGCDDGAVFTFKDITLEYKAAIVGKDCMNPCVKSSISVYVGQKLVGAVYYDSTRVSVVVEGEDTTISVIRAVMSKL